MDDLISRQAAIDWLKNEWDGMVTSVFDGIKNLPSAQPERKKGRWLLDEEGGTCYCSECKEENYYAYDWNTKKYTDKFCPNCGAQMQKGGNDDE